MKTIVDFSFVKNPDTLLSGSVVAVLVTVALFWYHPMGITFSLLGALVICTAFYTSSINPMLSWPLAGVITVMLGVPLITSNPIAQYVSWILVAGGVAWLTVNFLAESGIRDQQLTAFLAAALMFAVGSYTVLVFGDFVPAVRWMVWIVCPLSYALIRQYYYYDRPMEEADFKHIMVKVGLPLIIAGFTLAALNEQKPYDPQLLIIFGALTAAFSYLFFRLMVLLWWRRLLIALGFGVLLTNLISFLISMDQRFLVLMYVFQFMIFAGLMIGVMYLEPVRYVNSPLISFALAIWFGLFAHTFGAQYYLTLTVVGVSFVTIHWVKQRSFVRK